MNPTSKFDITAFRLFNMNHCEALIFSHEADWGIRLDTVLCPRFHPFEIIHWCFWLVDIPPCDLIQTLDLPPKHRIFPSTKLGKKRGGKRSWEGKLKFYTHNFVSFRPTHHMLEGKCHVKQLSLVCVFHFDWNIEQHVHETCLFWTHTFFFEETLFHRCPLDYKQISASWHEAYSHTWISSKRKVHM